MDPTREMKARLGVARLLLEQQVLGSPAHVTISRLQTVAVCELLSTSTLGAQVRADLAAHVVGMKWHGPDMQTVLVSLS